MKSIITVTVLLCVLGLHAIASQSVGGTESVEKCTIPRKFEGKFKVDLKTRGPFGNTQQAFGTGAIHVDATNGRAAVSEKVYARGQTTKINIFMTEVNKKTTAYFDMPELKQCRKNQINAPILPGTLPKNTTLHVSEGIWGDVPVQIWEAEVKEGEGQAHVLMYLKKENCMIMSLNMNVQVNGQSLTVSEKFFDMKETVEDESVFDAPEYCAKEGYHLGARGMYHHPAHHQDNTSNRVHSHHNWHLQHATTRHGVRRHLGV